MDGSMADNGLELGSTGKGWMSSFWPWHWSCGGVARTGGCRSGEAVGDGVAVCRCLLAHSAVAIPATVVNPPPTLMITPANTVLLSVAVLEPRALRMKAAPATNDDNATGAFSTAIRCGARPTVTTPCTTHSPASTY